MNTDSSVNPQTRIVSGTIWMFAMRWAMQLIGFVSTIILARLIAPQDFGLIAMAMIVVALLDTLSSTSVDLAIIRERDPDKKLYNAGWTLQLFQNTLVALAMVALAPLAVDYFDEPRIRHILYLLAVSQLVAGSKNIGILDFRKELDFDREFRFSVYVKLSGFLATVGLAFIFRDYRAILFGTILKSASECFLSYAMNAYRPRLAIAGMGRIWSFSQWLLVSAVIGVINGKASQFVIGGSLGATVLGLYYVALDFGTLFINEIVMPLRRALFPNLSLLLYDPVSFNRHALAVIGVVAIACMPIGVGLHLVAGEMVVLLLGSQWLEAAPLLRWTAFLGIVFGFGLALNLILMVQKKVHLTVLRRALECAILLPALYWVSHRGGDAIDIAAASLMVSLSLGPLTVWVVAWVLRIPVVHIFLLLWRPRVAGLALFAATSLLLSGLVLNPFVSLLVN
ncbi:MAG: oligosaccharide flippase family protein, partial [Parahaliea sp.]